MDEEHILAAAFHYSYGMRFPAVRRLKELFASPISEPDSRRQAARNEREAMTWHVNESGQRGKSAAFFAPGVYKRAQIQYNGRAGWTGKTQPGW
jgi:hypothetical protein